MFRRKEDSLFDSTDSSAPRAEEAGSSVHPQPAPAQPAHASASNTSGGAFASHSAPTAPQSRPATSFRPTASSSTTSDLPRNRMPETKPVSVTPSTSQTIVERGTGKSRRVLTVGNDILLKGEIATCDRLVIEGKVDATLNDVHTVEISETGSFKGAAHIEDAEISGIFEGDLVVRGRLTIYSTGRVRGKISYGEVEIERGGELSGEIKTTTAPAVQTTSNNSRLPRQAQSQKEDLKNPVAA